LRGSMVGHYGAAQHLNFDIHLIAGNFAKYFAKIFFLTQFASYNHRHFLYSYFEKEKFGWLLFSVFALFAMLFIVFHKKLNPKFRIAFILFGIFFIALLPILNLFFSYIVNVEGDRFTYFASIFAYQLIALLSVLLFRKWGWILMVVVLFFNTKFLLLNTRSWGSSKLIQQSLIKDFRWYKAPKIFLLNIPDNFKGTYMYRSFPPDNSFAETLSIIRGDDIESKTTGILEYNMSSASDSVKVEKISDNELKVGFAQQGNWWWNNGIGGSSYSTDDFAVKIDEWNSGYNLTFKRKTPNAVYLYQCGGEWREVKDF
jgi:hypothetical protein